MGIAVGVKTSYHFESGVSEENSGSPGTLFSGRIPGWDVEMRYFFLALCNIRLLPETMVLHKVGTHARSPILDTGTGGSPHSRSDGVSLYARSRERLVDW